MHNQGLILKLLIKKHKYTQETFAEKLGVSRGFVQSLTAKNKLTDNMIDRLAKALDEDKNAFFNPEITELNVQYKNEVSNVVEESRESYGINKDVLGLTKKLIDLMEENQKLKEELKSYRNP